MRKAFAIFVSLLFLLSMLGVTAVVFAGKPDRCEPWPECKGGGEEPLGTEYQILEYPGSGYLPRINGNIIVWRDDRTGNGDVYEYYLGPDGVPFTNDENEGEYIVSPHPDPECRPAVYGNKIVWKRWNETNAVSDIFMYHLGNDWIPESHDAPEEGFYQLATTPGEINRVSRVDIYENLIVYLDRDVGSTVLDLGDNGIPDESDSRVLIPDSVDGGPPRIWGDKVIFVKDNDIHIYYISGPRQGQKDIHHTPNAIGYFGSQPRSYGNIIVWDDRRNIKGPPYSPWDIYMYDLGEDGLYGTSDDGGETPLVVSKKDEVWPAIHGDKVVFVSNPHSVLGIHNLITGETEKTSSSPAGVYPEVFGNHIVYSSIYLYILN